MSAWYLAYVPVIVNFFTYAVSAALLRAVTAITSLMTLRVLTPAEFGGLALVNTFVGIFPIVLNLGLRQALFLEYFHLTDKERWQTINQLIAIYLIIAVPIIAVCLCNVSVLQKYLFLNSVSGPVVIVALVYCFLQFFSELYLHVLRCQLRAWLLSAVQISAACVSIGVNIALVFGCGLKVLGAVLANTIGLSVIVACACYSYVRVRAFETIDVVHLPQRARYLFSLGLPFVPNILFAWVLSSGNRYILAYLSTMDQVGLYALADMFGQAFNLCVLYPLGSSYVPYMLDQYSKKAQNISLLERRNYQFMWVAMAVALVLITIGTLVAWWIGPYLLPNRYIYALRFVWWILLANIFLMGTYFSSCILVFYKKTWRIVGMNVSAMLVQLVVALVLIPWFGIAGALCAQVCAYSVFFYLNYVSAQRLLHEKTLLLNNEHD